MLDNLRRKLSHSNYENFHNRVLGLARAGNLICYKNILYSISAERCTKRASTKSFKPSHKSSRDLYFRRICMKMIFCPAGMFTMGHRDQYNNKPRTEVIDTPFLLGQTEVTQELYEKVMKTNPSGFRSNNPQNPVENVSWRYAILFCNKLSELQGLDNCYTQNPESLDFGWDCDFTKNGYRLPREKEWEYAAKAGTQNKWSGTDNEGKIGEYAVYSLNSRSTQPVGSKAPNEWGFYDMSGNVSEWCWDKYNPKDDDASASRNRRGGGWDVLYLRVDYRCSSHPDTIQSNLGFRICRTFI